MDMLSLALPIRARPWAGYGLALLLTLAALSLRFALGEWLAGFPFLTFVIAIVFTAFFCGTGPAFMATALGGLLARYYLIDPTGSLWLAWPSGWIAMLFYILLCASTIGLTHGIFRRHDAQLASEAALRALTVTLEDRVAERTAALQAEMLDHGEAQAQLRQMQKMESIGQLTGGIAHDFNNMLAIIIGSLDMARRRLDKGELERVATAIDAAGEGARRAAMLTARLLAFSRQQPLEPQALDANRLVSGMSELLRRTIGEHIRIETVLSGGLWLAFADPAQLESAIVNLAVNARDAMPDGGKLTIETANTDLDDRYAASHAEVTPGQYVLVSITDSGTGMAPEVIERAFDPFYTTKGVGKGTGLGLSQVFGYVKQSGGHVKIYSEVGQGTTIKLYLPRHRGEAARGEARRDRNDGMPVGRAEQIVLVVEDEQQVRHMTVDALRELGYTVVPAGDAKQALEQIAAQPRIDLLFTDIMMPEMNGRQLADRARALRPGLPVLFTTGYTRNAVVHNGMLDAGVAFLPKPFTMAQLAAKVHAVLNGQGANRPD
jgi:signal transduction histidine kinase/CheY-like chemotaxis protein